MTLAFDEDDTKIPNALDDLEVLHLLKWLHSSVFVPPDRIALGPSLPKNKPPEVQDPFVLKPKFLPVYKSSRN